MLGLVLTVIVPTAFATEVKYPIGPQFDQANGFSEGLALVKVDNKHGFIDKTGKMLIKPQFGFVDFFHEGLAAVKTGEKWSFINKYGEIAIEPQFDYAYSFNEGLAPVESNGKYGFINNPLTKTLTPKISIALLDDVPFVEGDHNEFFISAKDYTGQVQYQLFYIQESVMKDCKLINNVDMVNGWSNPIDAQTPIIVDISNLNLKADKYRFAIRVRRVGVTGLKQNSYGDYDDAYPFNVDVVKSSSSMLQH